MSDYQGNIIIKNPAVPTGPAATGRAPGMWKLSEVAYWVKQGVWPDANIVADPYFPYVSLLLSSTSLSNANNNLFVDSSGAFNPVSRFGNTTQGSFSPYSTNWSNYFDNTGDYLSVPANAAMSFGTGNFTIEAWVYATTAFATDPICESRSSGGSAGGYAFLVNSSGYLNVYQAGSFLGNSTIALTTGTWNHVALVRNGTGTNQTSYYVNGFAAGTITLSAGLTDGASNETKIGGSTTAGENWGGYISNLRVVKGTAVYTANFTPPTAPLTAISGTSLLTCQSNRFRDASSNNFTITPNGDTRVTDFGPFSPAYPGLTTYNQSDITNWSGYFDGSGDYLSTPTLATIGSGSFSQEAWVFASSTSGTPLIWDAGVGAGTFLLINGTTSILGGINGTTALTATYTLPTNQWTHLVYCRSGTTLSIYANGTRIATGTVSTSAASGSYNIGAAKDATRFFTGYISNLRFVTGSSAYDATQATITVPTTSLTAISGTSLLTCQNAAFTDNSTNNFVITQNGNPTVTGNSPFNPVGYWSNYLTTNSFITLPNSAALQLGAGDFCVEAWVSMVSLASASSPILTTCSNTVGAGGINFAVKSDGSLELFDYATTSLIASGGSVPIGRWTHVAATRSGSTLRLFINGAVVATGTTSSNFAGNASQGGIGSWVSNGQGFFFNGYISNLRVVKGSAVYTSAFTPPTTPLTAISGTTFLTCQSSRFADTSSSALTLTPSGSPSVQSFDPFYTATTPSNGGSMYFDGNGDYLRGANSPAFAFGTGDFTVEMWAYFMDPSATNRPLFDNGVTSNTGRLLIRQGNDGGVANVVNAFVSGTTVGSPTIQFYSWTHVAVVRQSGTVKIYINGVGGTGATATADLSQNGCLLGAFYDVLSWNFTGYMSNVRVTKGAAVYTADFTPPTAPVNPTPATTLLVNGMNAGIYDATTINDMETVGNAQVSTVQSKFGGSSVYFNGTTDFLRTYSRPLMSFGTGNFTIETWVYPTALASLYGTFIEARSSPLAQPYACGLRNSGGVYKTEMYTGTQYLGSTTVNLNTWTHIAITRSSGTLRIFVNGVLDTAWTGVTEAVDANAAAQLIGALTDGAGTYFPGYMDDFRVTRGVARYTANFTPPTQPFPVY